MNGTGKRTGKPYTILLFIMLLAILDRYVGECGLNFKFN